MSYTLLQEQWFEKFAWLPVRSTWNKRLIWLKKYHTYEYMFLQHQEIKKKRFVYTKNEYLMMILNQKNEE